MLPFTVSQDITNTLWAYATLKEPLPSPFLEAAAQRLQTFLPDLGAPAMCQIAFAYAHYRHSPSNDLLDSMALQFQQLQPPLLELRFSRCAEPTHFWGCALVSSDLAERAEVA